jgi:hypothetical protein
MNSEGGVEPSKFVEGLLQVTQQELMRATQKNEDNRQTASYLGKTVVYRVRGDKSNHIGVVGQVVFGRDGQTRAIVSPDDDGPAVVVDSGDIVSVVVEGADSGSSSIPAVTEALEQLQELSSMARELRLRQKAATVAGGGTAKNPAGAQPTTTQKQRAAKMSTAKSAVSKRLQELKSEATKILNDVLDGFATALVDGESAAADDKEASERAAAEWARAVSKAKKLIKSFQ